MLLTFTLLVAWSTFLVVLILVLFLFFAGYTDLWTSMQMCTLLHYGLVERVLMFPFPVNWRWYSASTALRGARHRC